MRVALISLIEPAGDDPAIPLASLALAGRTLAERQLQLVLALGCERIICLSRGLDRSLIALQHRAEAAGAKFNLVTGARTVAGLVNAADELVVVAEGLLPAVNDAKAALSAGTGVLVLPVETGIAAGFERVDLNHAWAGVLAMPGGLVERLNQLPPDCDTISALLRIALQGRVPERALPQALLAERRWAMVASRTQLAELEPEWFRRHVAAPSGFAPGRALARLAMRARGAALLARGWTPRILAGLGVAIAFLGGIAAWFGFPAAALLVLALGWLATEAGGALTAIARAGSPGEGDPERVLPAASIVIDALVVAILAMSLPDVWLDRLYPPLMLIGTLRLAGRLIGARWAELAQDRAVLAVFLALAVAANTVLPAIQLLSLVLIAAILGLVRATAQLTRA